MAPKRIHSLSEIADDYDAVFCDVWGVLHNGVSCFQQAASALGEFRKVRGPVIMITNAPRPHGPVLEQMARLGVPEGTFDQVVTSGDVTRTLIDAIENRAVYHIGPERDKILYEGLDVTLCDLEAAHGVVCTGLVDDHSETPDDYRELLEQIRARNLPFICANPDIMVEYGDRLLWCSGALARDYGALGGETRIVGKPHRPIYEMVHQAAEAARGSAIEKSRILAIGDGLPTDIAGAENYAIDVLYITAGIHTREYGEADAPDHERLTRFLAEEGRKPVAYMPRLKW